jgi:hypothetical protein
MASRARWAGFAAVAAAACVAVGFFGQRAQQDERMSGQVTRTPLDGLMKSFGGTQAAVATTATASSSSQPVSLDAMLDQLVAWHADPFPPEARSTDELLRFEPHVGVPVKRSALKLLAAPSGKRARFNGARMMPVRDGSARATAALQYTIQGHRMTVYVFDSRAMPLRLTRLKERRVQEKPVYVGNVRGYSVAAAEQGGVGYALASDLDDDRSVQMVASF